MSEVKEGFIEVREEYLFLASAALRVVAEQGREQGMNMDAEFIALAVIENLLEV